MKIPSQVVSPLSFCSASSALLGRSGWSSVLALRVICFLTALMVSVEPQLVLGGHHGLQNGGQEDICSRASLGSRSAWKPAQGRLSERADCAFLYPLLLCFVLADFPDDDSSMDDAAFDDAVDADDPKADKKRAFQVEHRALSVNDLENRQREDAQSTATILDIKVCISYSTFGSRLKAD